MTYGFPRKTALIALVILLLAACVFFACACEKAETVTVDFFVEEEIIGGETLSLKVSYTGPIDAIASYEHEECLFTIVEGENVASVRDGKLVIAEAAEKGAAFTVRLEVKGITLTKEFIVSKEKPIVIESVTVLCPDQATAGATVSLSAEILPAGINVLPIYTVLSGNAVIEGNVLKVSEDAEEEEIRIVATAAGVTSSEKIIRITTVQTHALYLTLSRDRGLPGESIPYVVTKEPTGSSYPVLLSIEGGEGIAEIDEGRAVVMIDENAPMHAEFTVVARSGKIRAEQRLSVDYPAAEEIVTRSGGIVPAGGEKRIEYSAKYSALRRMRRAGRRSSSSSK